MIVTLTGENDAERSAELVRIVCAFVEQYDDMAVERLDGEEATYDRMAAAAESVPFLVPRKLVVLRMPSLNKEFAEKFGDFVHRIADTSDVVLVEPKLDKRLTYYKQLKELTEFREFAILGTENLVQYVQDYAKEQGGSIAPSAARVLVERTALTQLGLRHEIDKLLSYDSHITEQSIELLTEKTPQSTVFDLLEAAFAGNTKSTLALYEEQRALKVEPQQIIAMLAWQLYALALVKSAQRRSVDEIARETKLKPFVIRKSQDLARSISLVRLKELVTQLREFDVRTKSEGIIADEAVRYYLLQLAL
jgi:DNA polymerase-3 subunit delta